MAVLGLTREATIITILTVLLEAAFRNLPIANRPMVVAADIQANL
jgi:hypothetical protein